MNSFSFAEVSRTVSQLRCMKFWPFVIIRFIATLSISRDWLQQSGMRRSVRPVIFLHSPTIVQVTLSSDKLYLCFIRLFRIFYLYIISYWNQLCIVQWKWITVLYGFQLIIDTKTLTEVKPTHHSCTHSKILLICQSGARRWQSNSQRTDSTVHSHAVNRHNQTTAAYLIVSKESRGTRELSRLTRSWCPSIQPVCRWLS